MQHPRTGEQLQEARANPGLFSFRDPERSGLSRFRADPAGQTARSAHHPRAEPGHGWDMPRAPEPQPTADGPKPGRYNRKSSRHQIERPEFDRVLADLASRQYGLIALWQLPGLDEDVARQRAATGRLHRVHQGVYCVGHRLLPRKGHLMAAVLACGPRGVLSHRSAAFLHGILDHRGNRVDVIAPNRRGRAPTGIAAHRDGTLTPIDRVVIDAVPCTSLARTLLDLAATQSPSTLAFAVNQAEVEEVFDLAEVVELLKRSRGRRGVARLRLAIELHDPQERETRRELEKKLLRLFKRGGFRPEVNGHLVIAGISMMPDFMWRDARLIVEADSRRVHGTATAFEKDRQRDQRLAAAGWTVIRCTWHQVTNEPERLTQTLRTLLTRRTAC
jgi:very-short-patch-repair endonuclease